MTQWEPLTDFENDYEVETEPPHRIRRKRDGLMLKTTLHKATGYVLVSLNGEKYYYHRILAKHFIPNPDDLPQVDHIDRNRANNTLENLRWVTRSQNSSNRFKFTLQKREYMDHAPNDITEIKIFNDIMDVWLFEYDGEVDLGNATTDEVAQVAWMKREQIKELFDANMFVDTLEYFFTEVDKERS